MKAVPDEPSTWGNLRPELRESWRRSAAFLSDPGAAQAPVELPEDDLVEIRQAHPLRLVLPVFDQLLIRPAAEAGLIVAIGDAEGRLLWVDGDRGRCAAPSPRPSSPVRGGPSRPLGRLLPASPWPPGEGRKFTRRSTSPSRRISSLVLLRRSATLIPGLSSGWLI